MINKSGFVRRVLLAILTASLGLAGTLCTGITVQAAQTISNPRIVSVNFMNAKQKVTYDCVYFGSYPQAEVVKNKSKKNTITESAQNGQAYIVDADLYAKLESATKWDQNGDIVIGGSKYRRLKKEDATYATSGETGHYNWNDTYHYFKYQPIKWRVLVKNSDKMYLLADVVLDCQRYNTEDVDVTWATSTVRSWLNGYGSGSNAQGISYKNKNFADTAFTKKQCDTILKGKVKNNHDGFAVRSSGANTSDKIFLLADYEVYQSESAKKYGFHCQFNKNDEARQAKSSSYAKAMGCSYGISYGNSSWWMRSRGSFSDSANCVRANGTTNGYDVVFNDVGVRPALKINLKSAVQYKYAGTVCTDGRVSEVPYKK